MWSGIEYARASFDWRAQYPLPFLFFIECFSVPGWHPHMVTCVLGIPPRSFPLGCMAFYAGIGTRLARGFDMLRLYLAAVFALGFFTQVIGSSPVRIFGPGLPW